MHIEIIAFIAVLALIGVYFYYLSIDKRTPIVIGGDFGTKLNKSQNMQLFAQKLKHQNIAFIFFLLSLAVSFGLGIYLTFKLNAKGWDKKNIMDGLEICGGALTTLGFKRLYNKCSRDISKFEA